jgi:hypothetical protein
MVGDSRRSVTLSLLLAGLAGCGARSTLRADGGDGDGGAGGSPATSTSGGFGGAGGSGGSGGDDRFVCVQLSWAGDAVPISLPFAPLAEPELVRVGPDEVALVVRGNDGAGGLVTSLRVSGAFADGWAPTIGAADANFPTNEVFAVGEGEPGSFAFAVGQPGSQERVLAQAEPGQNGSQFVTYFSSDGGARALARDALGSYAVARGDVSVFVDVLDAWTPDTFVRSYGGLGCADTAPLAGVVPTSDGAFLVASTADQPFDDCSDPDLPGPPLAAHVYRLDGDAAIQGSAYSEPAPVRALALAPRQEGAWLLLARDGSPTVSLQALDDLGLAVGNPWTWTHSTASTSHDLARLRRGYALATTHDAGQDAGQLLLTAVRDGADFTNFAMTSADELGVQAAGKPALLVDEERGRILVAVIDATSSSGGVRLMRADCGFVGE